LEAGFIRTPLPPKQTFMDDPLRVLRCIRFASRFNFEIVDDIIETVKDKEIRVSQIDLFLDILLHIIVTLA
jgi:tRNA nucleotidyltransferase (CCA-adding enzyme)